MNECLHAQCAPTPAARLSMPSRFRTSICLPPSVLLSLVLTCALSMASADTFTYDDAGRLTTAAQSTGVLHAYAYDDEGNLLSATHSSTDTTDTGGPGNGIPDWWENFYFGTRGIAPLACPRGDGVSNLLKYALGLNPLIPTPGAPVSVTLQTYQDGKIYPYLTFVRFKEAAGILQMEQSGDLRTWQSGSLRFAQVGAVEDLGNGTEKVVLRSLIPVPNALIVFFRLKVSVN